MTIKDYNAQIKALDEDVTALESKISSLKNKAAAERRKAKEWRNQKGNEPGGGCKGTKKKRRACEKDAQWKETNAKGHDAKAAAYEATAKDIRNNQLPAKAAERAELVEARDSIQVTKNEISLELSRQGTTEEAVMEEIKEQAKIDKEAADLENQIRLFEAQEDVETKKLEGNAKTYLMIGGGVLLLLIIGFVAYKKLKK